MGSAAKKELSFASFKESAGKYNFFSGAENIVAAVSGGADSSAMLDLLCKLSTEAGFKVYVCHVNHNLRGEESLRDENFVRALSEKYGVSCSVLSADVAGYALEHGLSTEEAGRLLRYEFFEHRADELGEKTLIATAHTLSDRAETFLFNSARGAGLQGLCSIPPRRGKIIRPLIDFSREQIEEYCKKNFLDFVTDSSNLSDDYSRNKIRHGAIPVLKELNPSFEQNMAKLFEDLSEIRDFVDEAAEEALRTAKTEKGFNGNMLKNEHAAIKKAAAGKILLHFCFPAERERILWLAERFGSDFKAEITKGKFLISEGGIIFFEEEKTPSPEIIETTFAEGIFPISAEKNIKIDIVTAKNYNCSYKIKGYFSKDAFDYDKIVGKVIIRSRREGDRANLHGGTKTLKKLFIEEKIPAEKRGSIAVISDEAGVLWVEGLGAEKRARITEETKTAAAVRIIYGTEKPEEALKNNISLAEDFTAI